MYWLNRDQLNFWCNVIIVSFSSQGITRIKLELSKFSSQIVSGVILRIKHVVWFYHLLFCCIFCVFCYFITFIISINIFFGEKPSNWICIHCRASRNKMSFRFVKLACYHFDCCEVSNSSCSPRQMWDIYDLTLINRSLNGHQSIESPCLYFNMYHTTCHTMNFEMSLVLLLVFRYRFHPIFSSGCRSTL